MTDGVLAAIIAAVCDGFYVVPAAQASFTKDVAARAFPSSGKRKGRSAAAVRVPDARWRGRWRLRAVAVADGARALDAERAPAGDAGAHRHPHPFRIPAAPRVAPARAPRSKPTSMRRLGLEGDRRRGDRRACKPPLVVNTPALAAAHTADALRRPLRNSPLQRRRLPPVPKPTQVR